MKRSVCLPALFLIPWVVIDCGCSTREMKGTPFYSGNYEVQVTDAAYRRVNLWPLVYYHDPAFSLFWPIFEHTEEHLTLRPLFSAYGDTQTYSEFNVFWPLCRADFRDRRYRIAPYFWGTRRYRDGTEQDYHILFPFAWHVEDELCAFLPLWTFCHSGLRDGQYTEHDYWLGGPLVRFYNTPTKQGWHAFLFYDYRNLETEERYCGYPAPLIFSWRNRSEKGIFTPLYVREVSVDSHAGEGWSFTPPLLSCHSWSDSRDDFWFLGPLGHYESGKKREGWHLTLFGRYRNREGGSVYTGFPWPFLFSWQTPHDNGLFTPIFGYEEQAQTHEGFSVFPPLLAWHTWEQDADSYWLLGPLGHYERTPDLYAWHAALFGRYASPKDGTFHAGMPWPIAFSWRTHKTHGLFTPLYASQKDNAGAGTAGSSISPPLLYWHSWSENDSDTWIFGPLGRFRTGAESDAWHAGPFGHYRYMKDDSEYAGFPWPLAFTWRHPDGKGLFTPFYAFSETSGRDGPCGWAAAPFLLAWQTWTKDESDTWFLGPLGRRLRGPDVEGWHAGPVGRYHYLKEDAEYAGFPWPFAFSWRDRYGQGLFTPLYAHSGKRSGDDAKGWAAAPILLSWKTWDKNGQSTRLMGPLGCVRSGSEVEGWRATIFGRYHDLKKECTFTGFPWPLAFSWRDATGRGVFTPFYTYSETFSDGDAAGWSGIPLLLGWQTWQKGATDTCVLAGLYGDHRDPKNHAGHLFPFYDFDAKDGRFLTPLFGWDKGDACDPDGYWYAFTPLLGGFSGSQNGRWLFPLYSYWADSQDDTFSAYYLLLGRAFHSHSVGPKKRAEETGNLFFPLFSHYRSVRTNLDENDRPQDAGYVHRDYRLVLNFDWEHQSLVPDPRATPAASATNSPVQIRRTQRWRGLFPLWFSTSTSETRLDGTAVRSNASTSLLGLLYDSETESVAASEQAQATEYERHRILWRFWRHERRNGDVWIDIFPAITHDTRADGFRKTTFLWRFYRYERSAEGGVDLDLFFLPLSRACRP